jgi:tRNA nucleotidyltransferase (CCA-adding enzyme)
MCKNINHGNQEIVMPTAEAVLKKVLEKITPTEKERKSTKAAINKIMQATDKAIKPFGLKYTLAGSFLRDTWLADKLEFDIFILFPESVSRERLEKRGMEIGKRIVRSLKGGYEIAYAEHPYIRGVIDGFAVDFVPCYDIRDPGKIKSAVDRTPHHNKYILKNLTKALLPQVRLLKQFCKGLGVYGSDLRVEGFSGYLTELLIIRYKTFKNLLLEAGRWEAGKAFIDLEGSHKGKGVDAREKFPGQPLVVIDPVDRNRNVAAALSPANFELFKQSCASFLRSPSEMFFRPERKGMSAASLRKRAKQRGTKLIAVSFVRPGVVDDVIFPQLRRSAKRIAGMLADKEFRVLGHDVWCDGEECVLFFELLVWKLPPTKKLTGPPVFSKTHSEQFKRKYRGKTRLWVEGKNWVTEVRTMFPDAEVFMKRSLRGSVKALSEKGIASHVAKSLKKGFTISVDSHVIKKAGMKPGIALFLTEYFKKKIV